MSRVQEFQALKVEWHAWLMQQKPLERHWCTADRGFVPGVDEKAEERDTVTMVSRVLGLHSQAVIAPD